MSNPHKPAWLNTGAETNANPQHDEGPGSYDQAPPPPEMESESESEGESVSTEGGGSNPPPPPNIWKMLLEMTRKSNKTYLPLKGRVTHVHK